LPYYFRLQSKRDLKHNISLPLSSQRSNLMKMVMIFADLAKADTSNLVPTTTHSLLMWIWCFSNLQRRWKFLKEFMKFQQKAIIIQGKSIPCFIAQERVDAQWNEIAFPSTRQERLTMTMSLIPYCCLVFALQPLALYICWE